MNREEKILLLQLILEDIRGNWGWDLGKRTLKAGELAKELDLKEHISNINLFKTYILDGDVDGRYFRDSYKSGGYEGMEELHGLDREIEGKSEEFLKEFEEYMTYPEYRMEDWREYQANREV